MAYRIHVTAVRDCPIDEVRATFLDILGPGFEQVQVHEHSGWVWFSTSVWGVRAKDLNKGLCRLARPGLQFTTCDGDRWIFRDLPYSQAINRLRNVLAEAIAEAVARAGIPGTGVLTSCNSTSFTANTSRGSIGSASTKRPDRFPWSQPSKASPGRSSEPSTGGKRPTAGKRNEGPNCASTILP